MTRAGVIKECVERLQSEHDALTREDGCRRGLRYGIRALNLYLEDIKSKEEDNE